MNSLFIQTKTTSLLEIGTVCSQIVKSTSLLGKGSGDMSSPSTWGVGSTIACTALLVGMKNIWWYPIQTLFMELDNPTSVKKQNSAVQPLTVCLNSRDIKNIVGRRSNSNVNIVLINL